MTTAVAGKVQTQTHAIWIKATPADVWNALTDPEQLKQYGYGGRIDFDASPGGTWRARATDEMLAFGAPEVMVEGDVLEVDDERRLVQTWHALWDEQIASERPSTVTYELEAAQRGVTKLTVTHSCEDAPITFAVTSGAVAEAGGGWGWILSDLKSLLETGSALPAQMGC